MAPPTSSVQAMYEEMMAAVAPSLSRSDQWSIMMNHVHDVMTADAKTYKKGAFKSMIHAHESTPDMMEVYLESLLVLAAEKGIFLKAMEALILSTFDYHVDKLIYLISEDLFNNLMKPLIELFRADMLVSTGVYVPHSLVAIRLYWADFSAGIISAKDFAAAHKAGLQPPDELPKGLKEWLDRFKGGDDMDVKALPGKLERILTAES